MRRSTKDRLRAGCGQPAVRVAGFGRHRCDLYYGDVVAVYHVEKLGNLVSDPSGYFWRMRPKDPDEFHIGIVAIIVEILQQHFGEFDATVAGKQCSWYTSTLWHAIRRYSEGSLIDGPPPGLENLAVVSNVDANSVVSFFGTDLHVPMRAVEESGLEDVDPSRVERDTEVVLDRLRNVLLDNYGMSAAQLFAQYVRYKQRRPGGATVS